MAYCLSDIQTENVARIIAMQGDPYTGKTTIANSIAQKLQWQVISFDEILDDIEPTPPTTREEAETLMSKAIGVIVKKVKRILTASAGKSIIIDSSLSRRSHLHKLVDLRQEVNRDLIIIECKPKDSFIWETRFNDRDCSYNSKWYKPQEWPFDQEFVGDYADDILDASKLVVDTTDHVPMELLVDTLWNVTKADKVCRVELSRSKEKLLSFYSGRKWKNLPDKELLAWASWAQTNKLWVYNDDEIAYDLACEACNEKVMNSARGVYVSLDWGTVLHKQCAELQEEKTFSPEQFPNFFNILESGEPSFNFPTTHKCRECFSYERDRCSSCLFGCHAKSQLVPTVLHHKGHRDDLLFFWVSGYSWEATPYVCRACKCDGDYVGYSSVETCDVNYHPRCALLPTVLKHEHGGYGHELELKFDREKELDECVCSLCFENMNPKAWYYCCENCVLEFHLECAFKDFE